MVLLYMVTFTINIPQMLAYIAAPWILWVWLVFQPQQKYIQNDMSLRIISGRMETKHFSKTHDIMKTLLVGTLW